MAVKQQNRKFDAIRENAHSYNRASTKEFLQGL